MFKRVKVFALLIYNGLVKELIIGTAGHIDHGKTTLIKALTGIDTDRLQEEKRRGITIDIGFAHMTLGSYRLGFIDVPGHEKFVKNMLAGIGGIHLVLLVIAVDESIMPQTREHFEICKLLKISGGVVVLSKKREVESELLWVVEQETRELIEGSFLENAPIIAVDSLAGEGLNELKTALFKECERIGSKISSSQHITRVFRLPIDRVFTMRGFGTIVTGTPCSGQLNKNQMVQAYPSIKTGKIRGIEIFNERMDLAKKGQRTALNVSGLEKLDLQRGMVLSRPHTFHPSFMFDAALRLLDSAPRLLKTRSPVRLHHGSGEWVGRVYLLEGIELKAGHSALVQLRLDTPGLWCPADRFILRSYSPVTTIGGGTILDNSPVKHAKKDMPNVVAELRKLQKSAELETPTMNARLVEYLVKLSGYVGIDLRQLVARTGFLEEYLLEILVGLDCTVLVNQEPQLAVHRPDLDELKKRILSFLAAFHSAKHLSIGVSREELKKRFLKRGSHFYFQFVLSLLANERKIQVSASTVSLYGRQVELSPSQQRIQEEILRVMDENPWQPPTQNELFRRLACPPEEARNIYYFLLQQNELIRISSDLALPAHQLKLLKDKLIKSIPRGQTFTVAEFKNLLNVSRKYAIPFLEFLDREKTTRRVGDKRIVL